MRYEVYSSFSCSGADTDNKDFVPLALTPMNATLSACAFGSMYTYSPFAPVTLISVLIFTIDVVASKVRSTSLFVSVSAVTIDTSTKKHKTRTPILEGLLTRK
eukprot:GSChrysophyteH1.ASY1.ANO1.953.1 assembled CDS